MTRVDMNRRIAIALIALFLLLLAFARAPIADWLLPVPHAEREIARAQLALTQGRLSAADGSGALQRFTTILARDPDNAGARRGLEAVAGAAIARADAALARADADAASSALDIAKAAGLAPGLLATYRTRLRAIGDSEQMLAQDLERARVALAAGELDTGPDSALAAFLDVLARDPNNAIARSGRDDVLARLLRAAVVQAQGGDFEGALARIERVAELSPQHPGLPAARAALADVAGPIDAPLQLRALASALAEGRLEAARAVYLALAAGVRGSPEARAMAAELAAATARRAVVEAIRGRVGVSERTLAAAAMLSDDPRLHLADSRRSAWLQARQDSGGEWSAWFAAWPAAGDARRQAAQGQRDCVERAMTRIALSHADDCLLMLAALSSGADAERPMRERLARLWLGVGEERLRRGERVGARAAIAAAWFWAPNVEGGEALWQRLGERR